MNAVSFFGTGFDGKGALLENDPDAGSRLQPGEVGERIGPCLSGAPFGAIAGGAARDGAYGGIGDEGAHAILQRLASPCALYGLPKTSCGLDLGSSLRRRKAEIACASRDAGADRNESRLPQA